MPTFYEFYKTDEHESDDLGKVILRQGKQFKKSQNKITTRAEKDPVIEGLSNLDQTNTLLSEFNSSTDRNRPPGFSSALTTENAASLAVADAITSYTTSNPAAGYNIYCNEVLNTENQGATYLGPYTLGALGASSTFSSATGNGYDVCKQNAAQQGKGYFSVDGNGSCKVSSSAPGSNGLYSSCAIKDSKYYGRTNQNAVYRTKNASYIGCYYDPNGNNMTLSGILPNLLKPVYALGDRTSPPWGPQGSNTLFPDSTAQWIWNTSNAKSFAPSDSQKYPITFIKKYVNPSQSFTDVTFNGIFDDFGTVYINGIISGKNGQIMSGGWDGAGYIWTAQLVSGDNYIQVQAGNNFGPAGFIMTCRRTSDFLVLFKTDDSWNTTSQPLSTMNSNKKTFDQCKDYAKLANSTYFALQNVDDPLAAKPVARCYVSDLDPSQGYAKNGSATGFDQDNLGRTIGATSLNTAAVYQMNNVGTTSYQGKAGYVDQNGVLRPYPTNMVGVTPNSVTDNNGNPIHIVVNGDSSCPNQFKLVDSLAWGSYAQTGPQMSTATTCGLGTALQDTKNSLQLAQGTLDSQTSTYRQNILGIQTLASSMLSQIDSNQSSIFNTVADWVKATNEKSKISVNEPNLLALLSDSDILVLERNYKYLLWSVFAITIVLVTFLIAQKQS
jgi:hypothetical protein